MGVCLEISTHHLVGGDDCCADVGVEGASTSVRTPELAPHRLEW